MPMGLGPPKVFITDRSPNPEIEEHEIEQLTSNYMFVIMVIIIIRINIFIK
jgi:hypothetical protein